MQFYPLSIEDLLYPGKGGGGGGGGGGGDETKKKREGSPLINLELEVGCFGGKSCVVKGEEENTLFTAAQIQELYQQVLIFKYLSSGLPVPFHLLLPVWNSLASSLVCGFSSQEFDQSMMDPEPGRCRRTDGKKWRCRGSVLPDQKYCAKHMHRGSQRSRKPVEAPNDIPKSNAEVLSFDKATSPVISSNNAVRNDRSSLPVSTSLDLAIPSATAEVGSTNISYNSNSEGSSTGLVAVDSGTASSSLLLPQASKSTTGNESNLNDPLALGFNLFSTGRTYCNNQGNKNSKKPPTAAGFGVSPKSVLQDGIVSNGISTYSRRGTGCSNLSFDNKTGTETEELRCRRTDGKRWRCRRDVVPYKKYCENHLHRGARKATVDPELITGLPGSSASIVYDMPGILNTNLSMSIAATSQQMLDSDSSNSSDATTVSDEHARVPHILKLSPSN